VPNVGLEDTGRLPSIAKLKIDNNKIIEVMNNSKDKIDHSPLELGKAQSCYIFIDDELGLKTLGKDLVAIPSKVDESKTKKGGEKSKEGEEEKEEEKKPKA
jgi:hypothetical protein